MMNKIRLATSSLLLVLVLLHPGLSWAKDPVRGFAPNGTREQEIAQCLPGEIVTWNDGRDRAAMAPTLVFSYDPTGAPAWFSSGQVLTALQRAASAWSQCGVQALVNGGGVPVTGPGAIRVLWSDAGARGNFGLADTAQLTLSLGPAAFKLLNQRNPSYPAIQTLQMVISHEMGHLMGLMAHSRRCVDVMSYYTDGKGGKCMARDPSQVSTVVEYRSQLPTACDIQRCIAVNGGR